MSASDAPDTGRRQVSHGELSSPLLPYDTAIERIVAAFDPLGPTRVGLADALGLVLAEDVSSADDVPAFDNSAMDGYAVASTTVAAGDVVALGQPVASGVVTKVMTGHPIPGGADAVVPWERTEELGDGRIRILDDVEAGRFIRPRGEDVRAGQVVLRAGGRLGPVEVGVAASVGAVELLVHPRPRVGVLSTGDELVDPSEAVGPGRVRDCNGPLLAATVRSMGADVGAVLRAPDDPDRITAAIRSLTAGCDLVVTSGGASVGERDWLRVVLERAGELTFWRIAMRPGKPVALGRLDGVPVVVLPGNPGSVAACSHVVLGRAVRRLAGAPAEPATLRAELSEQVVGDPDRTVVHPVRLRDGAAVPAALRSSQVLSTALGADGWIVVPPGGAAAGTVVEVELR